MRYELGFVGAGNMAEAIARAAIDHSVVTADRMIAADPVEARRNLLAAHGIEANYAGDQAADTGPARR